MIIIITLSPVYYVLGKMLNDSNLSSLLFLATILQDRNDYYPYFIDEETKGTEELNNLHKA